MKIEPTKIYTLGDILRDGLLLRFDGKPYGSYTQIRFVLQGAGVKRAWDAQQNQPTYQIKGSVIIQLNKRYEQRLNNNKGIKRRTGSID